MISKTKVSDAFSPFRYLHFYFEGRIAMNKVEEVKELLTDTVARIYSTIKDNSLEVTKEKGKVPQVRSVRPTRHTIKWKAKNH